MTSPDRTRIVAAASMLLCLSSLACSGGGGSPPTEVPTAASITVTPATVTLPGIGMTHQLLATITDRDGVEFTTSIVWESSNPGVVSVDSNGLLTALAASGNADITATVDGVVSQPAPVMVTTPVDGAQVVTDSQVVGLLEPVDPDADFVPGALYTVTLTGISPPAVGTILIGTEEIPVAGEVTAVESSGDNIVVTLELLPLDEMFTELSYEATIDLSALEPTVSAETAQLYTGEKGDDGSYTYTLTPQLGRQMGGDLSVGPFKCETEAQVGVLLNTLPVSVKIASDLDFQISYPSIFRGLERFAVEGNVEAELQFNPTIDAALQGKIECQWEVHSFPVRVPPPLGLFVGAKVPVGFGVKLEGQVTFAQFGFDLTGQARATTHLGIDCPTSGSCEALDDLTVEPTLSAELIVPDLGVPDSQFRLAPSLFGYVFAKIGIENPFVNGLGINAFAVKAGAEQSANLATALPQITDTTYSSDYKLETKLFAGLDTDALKFFDLINVNVTGFGLTYAGPLLATSPQSIAGEITADWETYESGDTVAFTVELDPDTVNYVGVYNVADVVIFRKLGSMVDEEVARVAATDGQTEFQLSWVATSDGDGREDFHAFVTTRVLPLPPLLDTLELGMAESLDSDGDMMADGWELKFGLDPLNAADATQDSELEPDGLINLDEYNLDLDPTNPDTDGDGLPDGWEVFYNEGYESDPNQFNPADAGTDAADDFDGDGITNLDEYTGGTNPRVSDVVEEYPPRILFTTNRDGDDEIYIMDMDGSDQTNLTDNDAGNDDQVAASPDGEWIAFRSDRDGNEEVYVMRSDGTGQTNISNHAADDRLPVWSQDGTQLLFSSFRDGNWEIYRVGRNGAWLTNVTNNAAADTNPAWSPEVEWVSKRIAFDTDREVATGVDIAWDLAEGGSSTVVSEDGADDFGPLWSPDWWSPVGEMMSFYSERDGDQEIFVIVDYETTGITQLTNNLTWDGEAAWSADGLRIAYTSFEAGNLEIHVVNADGTNALNLTNSAMGDFHAAWSPDNTKIAFTSDRDSRDQIYIMDSDGNNQVNLSNNAFNDRSPVWIKAVRRIPGGLNDTGQHICHHADNGSGTAIPCDGSGQDGEFNANPMLLVDNGDGTVSDTTTGLMWQQDDDDTLYNWYEASGTADPTSNPGGTDVCGSLSLAGHNDWRLPTRLELVSITHYGSYRPAVDLTFFPNAENSASSNYITSTTFAYTPTNAWTVYPQDGVVDWTPKSGSFSNVRCVRGFSMAPSFADNGDGTVSDSTSKLMWEQSPDTTQITWSAALAYCTDSTLAGYADWRMPNIKELLTIVNELSVTEPAIDDTYFLNTSAMTHWHWTSTTSYQDGTETAWPVYFRFGNSDSTLIKSSTGSIRCVRWQP